MCVAVLGASHLSCTHLQVGHGHLIFHVIAGLLNGTEEVIEGPNVDARFMVCAQHGVGFPTAWGRTRWWVSRVGARSVALLGRGSWHTWVCPQAWPPRPPQMAKEVGGGQVGILGWGWGLWGRGPCGHSDQLQP